MPTPSSALSQLKTQLETLADSEKAAHAKRFFKTGPGEYGEGDVFRGIRVPPIRKLAKTYSSLSRKDVLALMKSRFHEDRMLALYILVHQFKKADTKEQKEIFTLYLNHTKYINGWDLVDTSAPQIVGTYLWERDREMLYKLAESGDLWERRIAILATLHFIRNHDFSDTLKIAEILLHDKEDLMHKAVGWMLREVGNRDRQTEEKFLNRHYTTMPRTMLRYAIEKFPPSKRKYYMKK